MGTGMSPLVHCHGRMQEPYSFAWFCPVCAKVWAKATVQGQPYMVFTVPCDLETTVDNYFVVPGSIWLGLWPEFLQSLSHEVLEREFSLHLAHYERYNP
ncbi:MAG TPA: hypothetical protein VNS88_06950 [Nitrospiraceae bacterium]|nr:hypothetical protein [Nitrospiraceae bacterium]